jgi:hypothetical protein
MKNHAEKEILSGSTKSDFTRPGCFVVSALSSRPLASIRGFLRRRAA